MSCRSWRTCFAARMCRARGCSKWPSTTSTLAASVRSTSRTENFWRRSAPSFERRGIDLPVYWGNRNWHPLFAETLRQMRDDGCKRALAFFTSMFSCYSGCRQYRENIAAAQEEVGEGAPVVEKVRMGFNHPGFIDAMAGSVRDAIASLGTTVDECGRALYRAQHSVFDGRPL